jgi:hypothetical protein
MIWGVGVRGLFELIAKAKESLNLEKSNLVKYFLCLNFIFD